MWGQWKYFKGCSPFPFTIFRLGAGSRDFVSAQEPTHKSSSMLQFSTFVFLGGTPVSNPLKLIKPNITFWASLVKTHWVIKDRMLSVQFPVLFSGQKKYQIIGIWKREMAQKKQWSYTACERWPPKGLSPAVCCLWSYKHWSKEPFLSDLTQVIGGT